MSDDALAKPDAPLRRRRLPAINPIYLVLVVLLVLIAVKNPQFIEPTQFMNFLKRAAPLAILSAGQLFVIIAGGFDLSAGSLITLTVIGASMLSNNDPSATWWVIALLFLLGAVVGLVNGLVVVFLRVPSLIATLGMMITLTGFSLLWSGGAPKGYLTDSFRVFGRYNFPGIPLINILPIALIVLVVVIAALWWLAHRTNYGRLLLAIGDNPRASQLAGVPIDRVRILAFVVSALSGTVAGILIGGFSGVSPDAGNGYELQAITAAVLGGAQLLGGRGSVPATVAGAVTLTAIFTLLNFLGLPNPLRSAVQGVILIGAVALAMYRRKHAGR
jgi:ribose transport system permease protein